MYRAIMAAVAISVLALPAVAEEKSQTVLPWLPSSAAWAVFHSPESPAPAEGNPSYLGVYIRDVRPDRVGELKLKEPRGAEITMVDRDGPAGKAGLKEHDVILSFNGNAVEDAGDLRRKIQNTPSGTKVSLGISRDGQPLSLDVQLGDRKAVLSRRVPEIRVPSLDIPGIAIVQHSRRYGLVVENLTPQLAEYFGAKNGQGILVRSVEKGSPADAAGFSAGDVIVRVGDERIEDIGDWSRILRNRSGEKVKIAILRNRKERTIDFSVPERRKDGGGASLEYSFPSLEQLQAYFNSFGENVQERLNQALRSQEMQDLLKKQRDQAAHLQKDLERLQPEFNRAIQQMNEQIRRALREHQPMD
jgi:serine protease Do